MNQDTQTLSHNKYMTILCDNHILEYIRHHHQNNKHALELYQTTMQKFKGTWISTPEATQLYGFLATLISAQKILEIGTFMGYATLQLALATTDDAIIYTCEAKQKWLSTARSHWNKAGVSHKIIGMLGTAENSLQQLLKEHATSFDMILIDADKMSYDTYYEYSIDLCRSGGIIILDDTLWRGRVIDETYQDASTQTIRAVNHKIASDPRVSHVILPMENGITICHKK